ncbi:MAG: DMT family transporter [Theionarchaea archaeon]|nr:DMT family transporter [Theionarchaea archaeon]
MTHLKHYGGLILAGCFFGTISIFSAVLRDQGVSSFQQAFFRSGFALPIILLVCSFSQVSVTVSRRSILSFMLLGMVMAGVGFFENTAVALGTPVAVVVLLLYTQPVWTALFGRLFLHELINTPKQIALIMAIAGMILISKVWNITLTNYLGILLALVSGVLLSVEFIMIKNISLQSVHYLVSIFWVYLFRTLFTLPLGIISGILSDNRLISQFTLSLSLEKWLILLLFALIPMVLGMILFYRSIKYVPIISTGIIMLIEPVSGIFYGMLLLGEMIDYIMMVGGILILLASVVVIKK